MCSFHGNNQNVIGSMKDLAECTNINNCGNPTVVIPHPQTSPPPPTGKFYCRSVFELATTKYVPMPIDISYKGTYKYCTFYIFLSFCEYTHY